MEAAWEWAGVAVSLSQGTKEANPRASHAGYAREVWVCRTVQGPGQQAAARLKHTLNSRLQRLMHLLNAAASPYSCEILSRLESTSRNHPVQRGYYVFPGGKHTDGLLKWPSIWDLRASALACGAIRLIFWLGNVGCCHSSVYVSCKLIYPNTK